MELSIDEGTQAILAVAHRRVDAHQANVEIEREREDQEGRHGRTLSFEVLLDRGRGFDHLVSEVLPRLTYHLRAKRLRAPTAPGAFLSLFVGEHLFFIDADAFYEGMRVQLKWTLETLREHIARWEKDLT